MIIQSLTYIIHALKIVEMVKDSTLFLVIS